MTTRGRRRDGSRSTVTDGMASSVGGAGGAAGPGLESRVLAWLGARVVTRTPLPLEWRVECDEIEQIGAQTGFEVDDIGAITDRRGYVLLQVKHRLTLSTRGDSDLADAIDQVVRQFIAGVPSDPDGSRRPFRANHDALVICTDSTAPATVTRHLREVVSRLPSHLTELPIEQVARNSGERTAVKVLVDQIAGSFAHRMEGVLPDATQIRDICAVLHLIVLDVDSGGADRTSAETALGEILASASTSSGAWNCLVTYGQELIEHQRWATFGDIRRVMSAGGHALGIDRHFRLDAERLKELTSSVLDSTDLTQSIEAPEGPVSVERTTAELVCHAEGNFVLIGEPGAGKSALARVTAKRLREAGEDVVLLTADSLAGTMGETRIELALHNNLDTILSGWDGNTRATLIIDGIDRTRGAGSVDWLPPLVTGLGTSRWRVIATIRTFDLRYGELWKEALRGEPIDSQHLDAEFPGVRHLVVGDLTDGELEQVSAQSSRLSLLLERADSSLKQLLRNPFNLSLAARILVAGGDTDITAVRTRQDLLDLYWRQRVRSGHDRTARIQVARALVEDMLLKRRSRVVDPGAVVDSGLIGALDGLLHDGVLKEDIQGRRADIHPVAFSHPVLFDFAVARCALGADDPMNLALRLDADPELAITVRPSLDMHFADLWSDDYTRESFWGLAVSLSTSPGGHPIAAVAAACWALRERPTHQDLLPVQNLALQSNERGRSARFAIAHLASALEAPEVLLADREAAAPGLAAMARELAAPALTNDDLSLADLARVLLLRLEHCFPLQSGSIGADDRALAVRDIARCCLVSPDAPRSEALARQVGQWLAKAAVIAPRDISPVVEAIISSELMKIWGVAVIDQLIVGLGSLAVADPDLARRVARRVWEFEDPRDEAVPIGNSAILGLSSTRQQELEMARFGSGIAFPAFLRAGPLEAVCFLLEVVNQEAPSREPQRNGVLPRVYSAQTLQFAAGHDALTSMSDALVARMSELASCDDAESEDLLSRIVALLVESLTHPEVWNKILDAAAASPDTFGRLMLPLADKSDLLGHYSTRASAARLVCAVSLVLSPAEHLQLERIALAACDPLDSDPERARELATSLVGLLEPTKIETDEARTLFNETELAGGPPAIPENPLPAGGFIQAQRLVERLQRFGEAPCAFVLGRAKPADKITWLDPGWYLGVQ